MGATTSRITTQEVVGTLKAAGLHAGILGRRVRRSGFAVRQFNPVAVAVEWSGWEDVTGTDYAAESDRMEAVLVAAGFAVSRPFPDGTILGVTRA